MPGSMRGQFAHFYMADEEAIATAMKTGLVVPDTNVVLNLYRFQSEARDQLFGALEKLGDRLWIPHQVGLEFHRNRISVIAEQEQYLAKMHFDLEESYEALRKKVLAFGGRIAHLREVPWTHGSMDDIYDLMQSLALVYDAPDKQHCHRRADDRPGLPPAARQPHLERAQRSARRRKHQIPDRHRTKRHCRQLRHEPPHRPLGAPELIQ